MSMAQKQRSLQVGDEVRWNDPDNVRCSGVYRIADIKTCKGRVNSLDDILVITNDVGSGKQTASFCDPASGN